MLGKPPRHGQRLNGVAVRTATQDAGTGVIDGISRQTENLQGGVYPEPKRTQGHARELNQTRAPPYQKRAHFLFCGERQARFAASRRFTVAAP